MINVESEGTCAPSGPPKMTPMVVDIQFFSYQLVTILRPQELMVYLWREVLSLSVVLLNWYSLGLVWQPAQRMENGNQIHLQVALYVMQGLIQKFFKVGDY